MLILELSQVLIIAHSAVLSPTGGNQDFQKRFPSLSVHPAGSSTPYLNAATNEHFYSLITIINNEILVRILLIFVSSILSFLFKNPIHQTNQLLTHQNSIFLIVLICLNCELLSAFH